MAKEKVDQILLSEKKSLCKKKFSQEEDDKIRRMVELHGPHNWRLISELIGTRSPRQCRERWKHYLLPYIEKNPWTEQEDLVLRRLHDIFGHKWAKIALGLPGRTDVNVKNRWALLTRKGMKEPIIFSDFEESSPIIETPPPPPPPSPPSPSPPPEVIKKPLPLPKINRRPRRPPRDRSEIVVKTRKRTRKTKPVKTVKATKIVEEEKPEDTQEKPPNEIPFFEEEEDYETGIFMEQEFYQNDMMDYVFTSEYY